MIIQEIIDFGINPRLEKDELNWILKIKKLIQLFSLDLSITILITPAFYVLLRTFFYLNDISISDFQTSSSSEITMLRMLILVSFEELGYRLWLSKRFISFVIGLMFYFFGTLSLREFASASVLISTPFIFNMVAGIYILFMVLSKNSITKNSRLLIWTSTIAFGLLHISNYFQYTKFLWLTPLLVIPQFVSGFFFAYTRVKLGFIYGILFHFLANELFILATVAISSSPSSEVFIKTNAIILVIATAVFSLFCTVKMIKDYNNYKKHNS